MNKPVNATLVRATLIVAPLVILVGRLLNVPHDDQRLTQYVNAIAAGPGRSDLGAALTTLGPALLIAAVLVLTRPARTRTPRLGTVSGALTIVGCVGMACVGAISAAMGQVVRHTEPAVARTVWDHYAHDLAVIDLMVLTGIPGFLLLAVGLYRSHQVPRPAAVLIGLGGAATMVTSEGPIRALLLTSTLILLAGTAWIAVRTPLTTDSRAEAGQPDPAHPAAPEQLLAG